MDVLIINCDKTYPLDSVEVLLKRASTSGNDTRIEKRYCNVSELQAVSEEVRRRRLLCGVFVVNAYESRLSINEDKAGIGYAVLYKALLEAAQGQVVVVIGGDDRYEAGEQSRSVLSAWAYHKIAAQFDDTYLDGRRGFVFSWDERHNPVHEEALGGYLQAITSGQSGLQRPFKPKASPPSTPRQTTTFEPPKKEAPTQTEAREDRMEAGAASISQQHTNAHGLTSSLSERQHDDKETNESQSNLKAIEDEHSTVDSSTDFKDPLGAFAGQSSPPQVTQSMQPYYTESKEALPGPSRVQIDPIALCLSLLKDDEESKLATGLKKKMEKATKGRAVKVIQLYVDGNKKSRYDYPKDRNVFPIPADIQQAINERKGEKGTAVIVVFKDKYFSGGVGWELIDLSDLIVTFPQQLREKIEKDRKGRIVRVIQIFVNGELVSRYDYPEGADVFHIPAYIQPDIRGKVFAVAVIFDDGPCYNRNRNRTEDLGSRCLSLDELIVELP